MPRKTFDFISKIISGVEIISEACCAFFITDTFIKTGVCASIPLVAECIRAVCSNFVKE